jgi:hypothetical protein
MPLSGDYSDMDIFIYHSNNRLGNIKNNYKFPVGRVACLRNLLLEKRGSRLSNTDTTAEPGLHDTRNVSAKPK